MLSSCSVFSWVAVPGCFWMLSEVCPVLSWLTGWGLGARKRGATGQGCLFRVLYLNGTCCSLSRSSALSAAAFGPEELRSKVCVRINRGPPPPFTCAPVRKPRRGGTGAESGGELPRDLSEVLVRPHMLAVLLCPSQSQAPPRCCPGFSGSVPGGNGGLRDGKGSAPLGRGLMEKACGGHACGCLPPAPSAHTHTQGSAWI